MEMEKAFNVIYPAARTFAQLPISRKTLNGKKQKKKKKNNHF